MFFLSETATSTEITLWACALGGSLFFLVRVLLALVGGFGAEDMDGMDAGDADLDGADAEAAHGEHDTEVMFKLLSLNSISAFIMMFGWSGLTALLHYELNESLSLLIAFTIGALMALLIAYVMKWLFNLTSAGAGYTMQELVGQRAKVYHRIPAEGFGKIHINVNGMLRELDAQSPGDEEIDSFTNVEITGLSSATTVTVKRISDN